MRIIETSNGSKIRVFASAKEAPIARYNEFQKYGVIKAGIGSSIEDIDKHYARIAAYLSTDKKQDAIKELENTRFALISNSQSVNYDSYCFACLVESIDGITYDDLTDEGLDIVVKKLQEIGITQQEVEDAINDIKKKINDEIEITFPSFIDMAEMLVYYGKMKMYLIDLGNELQKEEPNTDDIKKQLLWFQTHTSPMNFRSADDDNIVVVMDRYFSSMCSMMENNGSTSPEKYTCLQFYAKLDYLQKSTANIPS